MDEEVFANVKELGVSLSFLADQVEVKGEGEETDETVGMSRKWDPSGANRLVEEDETGVALIAWKELSDAAAEFFLPAEASFCSEEGGAVGLGGFPGGACGRAGGGDAIEAVEKAFAASEQSPLFDLLNAIISCLSFKLPIIFAAEELSK